MSWAHRCAGATTYRIAVGPRQGARCSPKAPTVDTLQTLPACEPDEFADTAGKVSGFSLHAGVAARTHERKKLERLCRYIALQGCRVLRRLGAIAPAAARRFRKSGFRLSQTATSATSLRLLIEKSCPMSEANTLAAANVLGMAQPT